MEPRAAILLRALTKDLPRRKECRQKVQFVKRGLYRRYTFKEQARIIHELHRSGETCYQLAERLKLKTGSVYNIVRRYMSNGRQILDHGHRRGRKMDAGTLAVMEFIRAPQRLQDWAQLTLQQRCQLVHRHTGIRKNPSQLQVLYNKMGIAYRLPKAVYLNAKKGQ